MTSIRQRRASIEKARALLAESPEARARKRAEAERARDLALKEQVRARMRAMSAIDKKLDEMDRVLDQCEEMLSWLMYGRSRWSR
jgi:hypothetical protein